MEIFKPCPFIVLLQVFAIIFVQNCHSLPSPETEERDRNDENTEPSKFANSITGEKTQILYMNTFNEKWLRTQFEVIAPDSTNYTTLVKSGVFVDKSLLLKVLFQDYDGIKCMLILYPRLWGKTTNLHMIGLFTQMELDKKNKTLMKDYSKTRAYQMFVNGNFEADTKSKSRKKCFAGNKKLLISASINDPVITEHLGKYAVIELTFSISFGDSHKNIYDVFFIEFKNKIKQVFKKFSYVQEELKNQQDLKTFTSILKDTEANETVWQNSILYLCTYLRNYFPKDLDNPKNPEMPKILILVDEYDFTINQLFFSDDLVKDQDSKSKIINFMRNFILYTFRDGVELYDKAVITGISRLENVIGLAEIPNFKTFSGVEFGSFPFYGFTESEVSELLRLRGKEKELEVLRTWYDGYRTIDNLEESVFYPKSVVKYLNNGGAFQHWVMPEITLTPYFWTRSGSSENSDDLQVEDVHLWTPPEKLSPKFGNMLKHFQILLKFHQLFNEEGTVVIQKNYLSPSLPHINAISSIIHGENLTTCLEDQPVDIAFGILFAHGYLGLSKNQPSNQETVSLKIPNLELTLFWEQVYSVNHSFVQRDDTLRDTVADNLLEYLRNSDEKIFGLCRDSIKEMFKNSQSFNEMLTKLRNFETQSPNFICNKVGCSNENEAISHFLMLEVLIYLQRRGDITLGSEMTSSYYSPFGNIRGYEYRIDLFAYNSENVTIIQMKADDEMPMEDILFQAELYLLFFDKLVSRFSYYKIVAVNFHHCGNVSVEHEVFNRSQVEDLIKTWQKYEQTAKDDYEKGANSDPWDDLRSAEAKRKIINVAMRLRTPKPIPIPEIIKFMPEELSTTIGQPQPEHNITGGTPTIVQSSSNFSGILSNETIG